MKRLIIEEPLESYVDEEEKIADLEHSERAFTTEYALALDFEDPTNPPVISLEPATWQTFSSRVLSETLNRV